MHRVLSAIITNLQPNRPRYLTKYPPVLFESRCSINPYSIRMAKCLPIAATLLPDILAIPLRWIPGFKRIIVYVALTLSFNVSFIVSLASLFLLFIRYWNHQFHFINFNLVFHVGYSPFSIFPSEYYGRETRPDILSITNHTENILYFRVTGVKDTTFD